MIAIDIPHNTEDPPAVESERVPTALRRAIARTFELYPKIENDGEDLQFDRLFEKLYNCKIEYNKDHTVSRIVWNNDYDYTMFLLKQ